MGILFIGNRNQPHLESFKDGLRERGYAEGKNLFLEYRYAGGHIDRLPALATALVKLKYDIIVTTAETGARAVRQVTKTLPIVLTTGADLVKSGLAESLAKPGDNITGLSVLEENFKGKTSRYFERSLSENDERGLFMVPRRSALLVGAQREQRKSFFRRGKRRSPSGRFAASIL